MKNPFEILSWDTSFFNFPVARVNGDVIHDELLKVLDNNNISLAYFSAGKPLEKLQNELYEIKPVDKKLTYLKKIEGASPAITIVPYALHYPEETLITLAIRSGIYSRFCRDEKIGRAKFEALYRQWIINAVEKKIAGEVLVRYQNAQLAGFVTIGHKGDRADIGLIAVGEAFGRQGIGKALLEAAEHHAAKERYKMMQVVTQADNTSACKLYESCGYRVEQTEFFYHLWKK